MVDLDKIRKLRHRKLNSNKYDFGHVLVVGGSPGYVGAPLLVAQAALRTGAGLVTVGSTNEVVDKLERRVVELMTLRLTDIKNLCDFIEQRKVTVLVVGSGMGDQLRPLAVQMMRSIRLPIVVDAGALMDFKELNISGSFILTPHAGEFSQMGGNDPKVFAKQHKAVVVLKGHPTIVVHQDGQTYKNNTGGPGLSKAGSGDVLSGVIAGLLAQGLNLVEAADLGVYIHGLAGDIATRQKSELGVIASDVIEAIPLALSK